MKSAYDVVSLLEDARPCVRDDKAHYLNYLPRVQRFLEQSLFKPEMKPLADWLERNHPDFVSAPLQFNAELLRNMLAAQ